MMICKPIVTLIATGTKLGKENEGSSVDPMLYKKLVGSIMYLTTEMHDIMFFVSLISIFIESPKSIHW